MTQAIEYTASAKWTISAVYHGRSGHYGDVSITVYQDGTQSSGGWSTPGGPLAEAQEALSALFAGEATEEGDCCLVAEVSNDEWLDSEDTTAIVAVDGITLRFSGIEWDCDAS